MADWKKENRKEMAQDKKCININQQVSSEQQSNETIILEKQNPA